MAKGNTSSIRYSDEVKEIIDNFEGNTFADKFHNLVLYCFKTLPKVKDEEKRIKHNIVESRKELNKISNQIYNIKKLNNAIVDIELLIKDIKEDIN
jgi:uncharacterized coiled-coil DUF342 family protein